MVCASWGFLQISVIGAGVNRQILDESQFGVLTETDDVAASGLPAITPSKSGGLLDHPCNNFAQFPGGNGKGGHATGPGDIHTDTDTIESE
jgi:hypothetical protein